MLVLCLLDPSDVICSDSGYQLYLEPDQVLMKAFNHKLSAFNLNKRGSPDFLKYTNPFRLPIIEGRHYLCYDSYFHNIFDIIRQAYDANIEFCVAKHC